MDELAADREHHGISHAQDYIDSKAVRQKSWLASAWASRTGARVSHEKGVHTMRSKASLQSHPIHPMLVSFPIALWVAGFIFDLIGARGSNAGLWAAGFYCVIGGCVGAVLSAAAGVIDWLYIIPPESSAKNRGLLHGGLNSFALLLFIYIAYRLGSPSAAPDGATLLLMGIGVVVLAISGWLGGTLVYRNQIGIDRRYASAGKLKTRTISSWSKPVCNQSELGDGQVLLVTVGKERVVVGRCSEGLFAFSDRCTHKGGPLSDGALIGCTVQCPWHGSQFDIRSGRVVAGPAQEKIGVYPIKISDGEVYVQPPKPAEVEPRKSA
jgi:nitrite reductase/ring-hydroxylating ferredoxin subunit/uncharacterized membrane protein